jgi:protoporphyrinogen oxidase
MPQYVTGHAERIAHVSDLVATLGGLHLTGASYKGSGLAACATAASTTAAAIAQGVAA